MKIQITQESLTKALSITSRFANSKAQLPVLGNILFSTKKSKLFLSSTNLEMSVVVKLAAKIEEEGDITVPSKIISELVVNLNPGPLDLKTEKEQLKITKDGYASSILGMNSSDFPKVPEELGKENIINLPKDDFAKSLSQVVFAASTDETRPILTGILVILEKDKAILVATDGFRLSQKSLVLKSGLEAKFTLPKNSILEATRLFEESEEVRMEYKAKENQVLFGGEGVVLSSRLIDGEYPDFQRIIPKTSLFKVNVDKEDFLRAVKLSSVLARDSANIVKLRLTKDKVVLFAESATGGVGESGIDAKVEGSIGSGGFEIAFNYKFLEDFLHTVTSEDVEFQLSDSASPGVFLDTKDIKFLHLIMPVRIQA